MKTFIPIAICATTTALGQGTFLFDQQSSAYEVPLAYGSGPVLSSLLPYTGQSFTPTLSGLNFIRLKFQDGGGTPASLYLNLRSDSISGTILGSSDPVSLATGFTGTTNFFFPTTVALTPSTTYYFEVVLQSGEAWHVDVESFNYTGGEAFANGNPWPGGDYWFREGLYTVPEPSAALLGLLGLGVLALKRARPGKHFSLFLL